MSENIISKQDYRHCVIGDDVYLLTHSKSHRRYNLSDIEQLIIPPINLGQAQLYKRSGKPVAYVSWAYLSEHIADRFSQDAYDLKIEDWQSGPHLWIMDFIAPFGGVRHIASQLKLQFPGKQGRWTRFDSSRNS